MDEEAKKRIAEFRFGVIHDLIGDRRLKRGEKRRLLTPKGKKHNSLILRLVSRFSLKIIWL